MCEHLVAVPCKEQPNLFETNIRRKPLTVANLRGIKATTLYILGVPASFPLIYRLYGHNRIFLFSKKFYEKACCQLPDLVERLPNTDLVEVDEKVMSVVRMDIEHKTHPVLKTMRWLNIDLDKCRALMYAIMDPRLFQGSSAAFSQSHIAAILKHLGLTYRVFTKTYKGNETLAHLCLRCWYSAHKFKQFSKELLENNVKRLLLPNQESGLRIEKPGNHFWRMYFNLSTFGFDPKAAFKTTKHFINLFLRLWGKYLVGKPFYPERLFKYRAVAELCRKYLKFLE